MTPNSAFRVPHSALPTPVIVNPSSGQGKARGYIEEIRTRLAAAGLEPEIVITQKPGDAHRAAETAVERGCETVVVAGGDGTVNEVLNGVREAPVKLGLVPLGTGNVLAREIGIPIDDAAAACDIIARGITRRFDLAKANGRYFALMAGFGFDASVVRRVVPQIKDLLGAAAYGFAIVGALLKHKAAHFTLELDGEALEVDAALVVVANSGSYAYNIRVAPAARMDDGLLDVCIFAKASPERIALLKQAWHVIKAGRGTDPNIIYFRASRIVVRAIPPVLVQIDGDVAGTTPTTIELMPACLKLIVPG